MANIVFLPGVQEIIGSRFGITFDRSQAGNYAKKRPSPINHNTNARSALRIILKAANAYFWAMTTAQKNAWATWAATNGITGPFGQTHQQAGCAGFYAVQINARLAGDAHYITPPGNLPLAGVTFTALVRVSATQIKATFTPSNPGTTIRIYLRQGLPGPGYRRWSPVDGYICKHSVRNPTSPYYFTPKFIYPTGWHCRFWTGTQETTGRRSVENLWDL